jgi:hypothetical protein
MKNNYINMINIHNIEDYAVESTFVDWIDPDEIDWSGLSLNPSAIEMLKNNPDEIDWPCLSRNPSIFGG